MADPHTGPDGEQPDGPAFFFGSVEEERTQDDSLSELHRQVLADLARQRHLERARKILDEWSPVVARLELDAHTAERIAATAAAHGTGFVREALASEAVGQHRLFNAIADELGLGFLAVIRPERLVLTDKNCLLGLSSREGLPIAPLALADGTLVYVVARMDLGLNALRDLLAQRPNIAANLRVVPPGVLRNALRERANERLLFDAEFRLSTELPEYSARWVMNAWQGVFLGALLIILLVCLSLSAAWTVWTIQILGGLAVFSCVVLRLSALRTARGLRIVEQPSLDAAQMPVYSVLVALYREREVISQLLTCLGKLQWPRSKLEIKLVCEEDDAETLELLSAYQLRPYIEIVTVPRSDPRTKPKALAYALPLCSGEFVTLFDAEDRPNPLQLVEAWHRFSCGDERLACVQAPLTVTNQQSGPIALMFSFEYAALFRGILPWLSSKSVVLPLGGTSNHFRRDALLAVGGWDAHNVTEDADLGLRLTRFGYRIETIDLPTLEEGPEDLRTWFPQRVRWFKGWIQTWLVHMREPVRLWREIGLGSFAVTQIVFLGTLLSVLIHPFAIATLAYLLFKLTQSDVVYLQEMVLAGVGSVMIAFGYGAFLALGHATLSPTERRPFWKVVLLTPFYWLLLSAAAWRALLELYRRPHQWNKTTHRRVRSLRARAGRPLSATAIAAYRPARR